MDAFKIIKNGRILDYRKAEKLDLEKVSEYFGKRFKILEIKQINRHVIATLETENDTYLLKLACSEGVGARSETEKIWNDEFNKCANNPRLRVPRNLEDGYFGNLYYIIMEKFGGPIISGLHGENQNVEPNLNKIIDFSEYIQTLPVNIPVSDMIKFTNHNEWFSEKTKSWLASIPENIKVKFEEIKELWNIVYVHSASLAEKPRHGDFTPWHMIVTEHDGIGLIDGEHAHSHGVEYYDICYFIQRIYCILKLPQLADKTVKKLLGRKYEKNKLRTVLASRAIGGFLDESFYPNADYKDEENFAKWVLEL